MSRRDAYLSERLIAFAALRRGRITMGEIALCAGVSRQLVRYWSTMLRRSEKIEAGRLRGNAVKAEWRKCAISTEQWDKVVDHLSRSAAKTLRKYGRREVQ